MQSADNQAPDPSINPKTSSTPNTDEAYKTGDSQPQTGEQIVNGEDETKILNDTGTTEFRTDINMPSVSTNEEANTEETITESDDTDALSSDSGDDSSKSGIMDFFGQQDDPKKFPENPGQPGEEGEDDDDDDDDDDDPLSDPEIGDDPGEEKKKIPVF